jgi:hypothetical protein
MTAFICRDLFDEDQPIKILTKISVLKTKDGGRSGPFITSYPPNHNFGKPDDREFYIGQIEAPSDTWIYPGETHDLVVTFLFAKSLPQLLEIGRLWRIQEGPKLVATAEIISIPDKA